MRRHRAPGAGNARELAVMKVLASEGWLCASRRHIGGAGDILAVKTGHVYYADVPNPLDTLRVRALLIEVKSTTRSPWVNFLPADRQAMVETGEQYGCEAWLYWWPPRRGLQRIPASEWPPLRNTQLQLEGET